jgi:hypothetical protein
MGDATQRIAEYLVGGVDPDLRLVRAASIRMAAEACLTKSGLQFLHGGARGDAKHLVAVGVIPQSVHRANPLARRLPQRSAVRRLSRVTMYPWGDLARAMSHERVKELMQKHKWKTAKVGDKTCIDARAVDDFFRAKRAVPSLQPQVVDFSWRLKSETEREIDRMLAERPAA